MKLSHIRDQMHTYLIESEDLYWRNWVGLQDEIDIVSLYQKYEEILSREAVSVVMDHFRKEDDPARKHQLRSLYGQIILSHMEYLTRDLNQEILKKEAVSTVEWEGQPISLRSFDVKIMNEPSREKRKEMIQLREFTVNRELNPLRRELIDQFLTIIRDLGYDNYISLCQETQNRDFDSFAREMALFLEKSEGIYRNYLDKYLKIEAGVSLDENTHNADLTAVMRSSRFDRYFSKEHLLPVLKTTLSSIGFNLDRVHLDLEDRPKKKPRPCVSAVNPPDDVRLTVYPVGGYDDYAGILHESGHAIHFTHEYPNLEFEFKYWGDRGFTEGTAYLFQHITMNASWLQDIIGMDHPEEFIEFNAFLNILRFRRLIAQFLYQLDLFNAPHLHGLDAVFKKRMETSHQVQFETSGYLNFDMEFYSAGYLRARLFEHQLRTHLSKLFGVDWWRSKKSADFLISLFRNGRKFRADDVVRELGYDKLDANQYLNYQLDILSGI